MKKDLQSYEKHHKEFDSELNSHETTLKIIEGYDNNKQFESLGFGIALNLTKNKPSTLIDIGSGTGWLLRKMSPYFDKVIGIEPSGAAMKTALKINELNKNVSVVNMDMIDGLEHLNIQSPVFLTTSTVLNHIEDYYIAEFLNKLNSLPLGSILFFDERYGKNKNWNMWHVRSKEWWRNNLNGWQVIFLDIENSDYPTGIYGFRTNDKIKNYKSVLLEKLIWKISYVFYFTQRILRKICRTIIK